MGSARQEEESSEFSSEFAGCVSCIQGASSPHLPTGQGWAGEPSATGWTLAAKSVTHPSGFCVPELGRAGEARVPEGSGVVGVHSALHTPSRGYAPIWAGSGCRGAVASLWLGSLSTSTRPCPASWGHGDQDPTAVLPQQHRTWFPGENSSAAPFPVPIPTWEVPKLAGRGGRPSLTLPPPPAAWPMTCHPDVRSRGAVQGRSPESVLATWSGGRPREGVPGGTGAFHLGGIGSGHHTGCPHTSLLSFHTWGHLEFALCWSHKCMNDQPGTGSHCTEVNAPETGAGDGPAPGLVWLRTGSPDRGPQSQNSCESGSDPPGGEAGGAPGRRGLPRRRRGDSQASGRGGGPCDGADGRA